MNDQQQFILFRDKTWQTMDGKNIKIKHLSHAHLANIENHMNMNHFGYSQIVRRYISIELYYRGLEEPYVQKAPFPFTDDDYACLDISAICLLERLPLTPSEINEMSVTDIEASLDIAMMDTEIPQVDMETFLGRTFKLNGNNWPFY